MSNPAQPIVKPVESVLDKMRPESDRRVLQMRADEHRTQYGSVGFLSDGYHTFDELYDHRIRLWISLCALQQEWNCGDFEPPAGSQITVWRSRNHSDGELAFGGGWFVLGLAKKAGRQMTYHLPESYWEECEFAQTLPKAPPFDEHTAADVLVRLKKQFD